MIIKAVSCFAAISLLALAACSHQGGDTKTPASDTMQSEVDVRIGPTPTNGITTPGNPDSSARAGAGDYRVVTPPSPPPAPSPPVVLVPNPSNPLPAPAPPAR